MNTVEMATAIVLTEEDLSHLRKVYAEEVEPSVLDETYDGPAIAMTSAGYVDVYADGEVYCHGWLIAKLEID